MGLVGGLLLWLFSTLPTLAVGLMMFSLGALCVCMIGYLAVSNSEQTLTLGIQSEPLPPTPTPSNSEPLPKIDIQIIEAFINPFPGGALCFLHCSLHNPTSVTCDVPRVGYSLSLTLEQASYETAKTIEVFTHYYLSFFEEVFMKTSPSFTRTKPNAIRSYYHHKEH